MQPSLFSIHEKITHQALLSPTMTVQTHTLVTDMLIIISVWHLNMKASEHEGERGRFPCTFTWIFLTQLHVCSLLGRRLPVKNAQAYIAMLFFNSIWINAYLIYGWNDLMTVRRFWSSGFSVWKSFFLVPGKKALKKYRTFWQVCVLSWASI